MDQPVVAAAEQDQVPEQSRPAVNPVPEMVSVGPLDRRVAAGEPAVAVPNDEGSLLARVHAAPRSTDVQWVPVVVDGEDGQGAVAGQAERGLAWHRAAPLEVGRLSPGLAAKGLGADQQ